jgi:glycosyltransferase involved in cell wall biosynthesis
VSQLRSANKGRRPDDGLMTEDAGHVVVFNQAYGPLLREFVDAVAASGSRCRVCVGSDWKKFGRFREDVAVETLPRLKRTSIAARAFSWLAYSFAAVLPLLRCSARVRVVVFSNPPTLLFFVWLCSLVRGYQYSVVVYDVYPDILVDMGLIGEKHPLLRIWRGFNRAAYERAFAVVTLGDVMATVLAGSFDAARTTAGKIMLSRPWVATALVRPLPKTDNPFAAPRDQGKRLTALYSGNMGETHDMQTIVGAAALMRDESRVEFLLIGDGAGFQGLTDERQLPRNTRVLPWQQEEKVPLIWAAGDIALISLRPGVERCSFPSKAAFALSAGCALIGITKRPSDLAALIDESGCGMVVRPGDAQGLAQCLADLANDEERLHRYRERARATAKRLFERDCNLAALFAGVPGWKEPEHEPTGVGPQGLVFEDGKKSAGYNLD